MTTTKAAIPQYFTDEELTLINDRRPMNELSLTEVRAQLAVYVRFKMWGSSRYYTLDHECQKRMTAAWVREDVFGHTFTGSAQ